MYPNRKEAERNHLLNALFGSEGGSGWFPIKIHFLHI
jgi:hypothetical protein